MTSTVDAPSPSPSSDVDACESSLARLITDKFTIDSAGKTPRSRTNDSLAQKFSARMLPQVLSFNENRVKPLFINPEDELAMFVDIEEKQNEKRFIDKSCGMEEENFSLKRVSNIEIIKSPWDRVKNQNFEKKKGLSQFEFPENVLKNQQATSNSDSSWNSKEDFSIMKCNVTPKIGKNGIFKRFEDKENMDPSSNVFGMSFCHEKSDKKGYKLAEMRHQSSKRNLYNETRIHDKFVSPNYNSKAMPKVTSNVIYTPYSVPSKFCEKSLDYLNGVSSNDISIKNKPTLEYPLISNIDNDMDFEESCNHVEYKGKESNTCCNSNSSLHCLSALTGSDYDFDTLHDLEEEFDSRDNVVEASCSKYEIISTDSPNEYSGNQVKTIIAKNLQFGSPIDQFGNFETSENFNSIPKISRKMPVKSETTRMLNFDSDKMVTNFKFIPPSIFPLKKLDSQKSPKINENRSPSCSFLSLISNNNTPNSSAKRSIESDDLKKNLASKNLEATVFNFPNMEQNKKMRVDSGIESDACSPLVSPLRSINSNEKSNKTPQSAKVSSKIKPSRLFNSASCSSMESGCISEMEEYMFDIEENSLGTENSISVPSSFQTLISGEIKSKFEVSSITLENSLIEKEPTSKKPYFRRCLSLQTEETNIERVRAALFQSPSRSRKRTEACGENIIMSKRRKGCGLKSISEAPTFRPLLQRTMSENEAFNNTSLNYAYNDANLIGDFSRPFCLPLENSQHQDLKAISSKTLAALIDGEFKDSVDSFEVIDCRYPYEFEGGHIVGAKNLFTEALVQKHLLSIECIPNMKSPTHTHILVFHCEFSFERGPKLCRFLRRADRALNRDSYPSLLHPELYVLRGGYRNFHSHFAHHCRPIAGGYTPMSDPNHAPDLKYHRSATSKKSVL